MDDGFREGLRVLLVDDDTASHGTLYEKLNKFNFQLNMCMVAETALSFIRHAQEEFDIVITARNMSGDMDAFKFVEQVRRLKKNLPIIMVLEGGEDNSIIEKGVQLGVDNYVIRPITGKSQRTSILVEHVFNMYRKRKTNQTIDDDDAWSIVQHEHEHSRKRKTLPNNQTSPRNDREESCGSSATPVKKPRLVWSNDLHHKFVEAV